LRTNNTITGKFCLSIRVSLKSGRPITIDNRDKTFHLVAGDKVFYQFETENVTSLIDLWDATMSVEQLEVAGGRFESIFLRLHERICFITEDGHPGIGPRDAWGGDVACVLWGCSYPVLLRKEMGNAGACVYSFLGPAYVDGAMNNEASGEVLVYRIR
jgi:hypothetical protein